MPVHEHAEITAAFEQLAGQLDVGLLVPSDTFTYFRSATIVGLAAKPRLSAILRSAASPMTAASSLTASTFSSRCARRRPTSIASSKAPSPATFQYRCRPNTR